MDRISPVTQEVVNTFPDWTRIRTSDQSVGFQLLNSVSNHVENLELNLQRLRDNLYLNTVNLKELSLIHKIDVSAFDFTKEFQNGIFLRYTTPTAKGFYLLGGVETETPIKNIDDGSIATFVNADPDRISSSSSFQGTPISISNNVVTTLTLKLGESNSIYPLNHHHTEGGKFYFILDGGYPYLKLKDQELKRSRIRIVGKNDKDEEDSETLIFPWKSRIPSSKNWKTIEYIEYYDIEDIANDSSAKISIYSEDIQQSDYLSLSNLRYSENRNKIDEFWGIIDYSSGDTPGDSSYLERVEYVTDDVHALLRGTADKFTKQRWRLKKVSGADILDVSDMALIPYQNKFWVIDETNLYLFPLSIENYEKFDKLQERDDETEISINVVTEDVVTGEEVSLEIWHEREISAIEKIKVWYTLPVSGTDVYLTSAGVNEFVNISTNKRILFKGTFPLAEEGTYVIRASVQYEGERTETDCRLFLNRTKKAIKEFDLTSILSGSQTAEGIYFDSNHNLQLKASDNTYYKIDQHKDIMLIDFNNKTVYLHEKYTKVTIE